MTIQPRSKSWNHKVLKMDYQKGLRKYAYRLSILLSMTLVISCNNLLFSQYLGQDSINIKRIHEIQGMLDKGKRAANTWWYGWLAGYSAATLAQSAVAITSGKLKTRQDMIVGAGTTLLGAAGQLLTPMTPALTPGKLSVYPENTVEERSLKLQVAEQMLLESANREKEGRSWQAHAVCSAVNLGSGLITWLGFKRSVWAGLGNFALNSAISEAQIWSQPRKAIFDYRHYHQNDLLPMQLSQIPTGHWLVSAFPGGISFRLVF